MALSLQFRPSPARKSFGGKAVKIQVDWNIGWADGQGLGSRVSHDGNPPREPKPASDEPDDNSHTEKHNTRTGGTEQSEQDEDGKEHRTARIVADDHAEDDEQ